MQEGFKNCKNSKNFCVWLTGLPCLGKTTIAKKLPEILGKEVKVFEGDDVRKTIIHIFLTKQNTH